MADQLMKDSGYGDNMAQCNGFFDAYSAGWYNMAFAVDPTNAEVVWAGGMEAFRSDDGGRSFGKASLYNHFQLSTFGVHADLHLVRFHPGYNGTSNQKLYLTNDGGLATTDNANAATHRGIDAACNATNGAIMEAMRLFPVAAAQIRIANKDFVFEGHQIREGEMLYMGTSVPHFMEEYYPHPEKFDIDRYQKPRAEHMQDNLQAGFGPVPDAALRERMAKDFAASA
jgi:hypothetical protein